ncbi:sialidase family protein [Paenibacillus dendritiformis]|uniref:sialidase family protein n=1 Tax=Paenibacillus dendritiformis TaxID=130049 RepID=UPI0036556027
MIKSMNTAKKKAGAAILSGALALTLGSGTTTFAAEGATDSLLVKHENGVINYSTDGGQTWSENATANMQAIKIGEGNIKIKNKLASGDGIKSKVMVKSENGKKLYSTDDGQTWSETAPEGMPAFDMGQQGNIKFKMKGDLEEGIKSKVMVKVENGKKLFSTDDGQTWSEQAPEGMKIKK